MRSPIFVFPLSLRLSLAVIAIVSLAAFGIAGQQASPGKNCSPGTSHSTVLGSAQNAKLDTLLGHPEDYFGKTVTVEGEMHRTFSDRVFSIEDDDFLRDDDLLIITTASKSEVVVPVKDSIEEGKDVRVTGVIVPFHRAEMECKYGPLQIESRASHYPEGSPVMIIEKTPVAVTTEVFESPRPEPALPVQDAEPVLEPVGQELETPIEEPAVVEQPAEEPAEPVADLPDEQSEELPRTAGGLPLLALGGVLSVLAGVGMRRYRR